MYPTTAPERQAYHAQLLERRAAFRRRCVRMYVDLRMPLLDIGRLLDTHHELVRRALQREGVTLRPMGQRMKRAA